MLKKKIQFNVGDLVKIISGYNKNKTGEIKSINRKTGNLIIKGINLKFNHIKPDTKNEMGEIKKVEASIDSSNVKLK